MITKRVLLGLIIVTTGVFSAIYVAAQTYLIAILACALGLTWLILENTEQWALSTVFFLVFAGLAIWGSLRHLPIPVMLLGFCADLAAWDLSRFRERIADRVECDRQPALEARHLRVLFAAIGAGFVLALLPTLVSLSISFVALFFVILLTMLALRRSIGYLRDGKQGDA
jgi:hypothetical protein